MSSGYFPLDGKYDDDGKALKQIMNDLDALRSRYQTYACELDCTEDGVSDGGYLERISIAIEMLKPCIQKEDKL